MAAEIQLFTTSSLLKERGQISHSMRVPLLLLVSLLSLACTARAVNPHRIDFQLPTICGTYDGLYKCAEKIESHHLRSLSTTVQRQAGRLCINAQATSLWCYLNTDSVRYYYAGPFENYHQVLEIVEESWAVLLISTAEGSTTRLPSYPVPNASHSAFAVSSFDVDAGFFQNIVQIWQIPVPNAPDYQIREFKAGMGPASVHWTSDNHLRVGLSDIDRKIRGNVILLRTPSGWTIAE